MRRLLWFALLAAALAIAADKKSQPKPLPVGQSSNESVGLTATLYDDKEALQKLVGSDLEGAVAVIEVRLTPRSDDALAISRDDFLLRSEKDGQRSQPFAPSQIAGNAALVVSSRAGESGAVMSNPNGPIWGGMGGGRPRRLPGNGTGAGNAPGESSAQANVQDKPAEKDNPLLATLKEKVLPEKKTTDPISGLLYFQLEGKHKPKDLVLEYKTPAGKLIVRFK